MDGKTMGFKVVFETVEWWWGSDGKKYWFQICGAAPLYVLSNYQKVPN